MTVVRTRARNRLIRRNKTLVRSIKEQTPCVRCARHFPFYVMDFDHVNGSKIEVIGRLVEYSSLKRLSTEILKCDVVCVVCHRIRSWERIPRLGVHTEAYQRNLAIVDSIKVSSGCVDCFGIFSPCAMDFDHVRGVKLSTIAKLTSSSSEQRLLEEIQKCEVVCANCHRIRTYAHKVVEV